MRYTLLALFVFYSFPAATPFVLSRRNLNRFHTSLGLGFFSVHRLIRPTKSSKSGIHGSTLPETKAQRTRQIHRRRYYDWRDFQPAGGVWQNLRWFVNGESSFTRQSDETMREKLASLARMLILLREYLDLYGMPQTGGPQVQRNVIAEITRELYQSGAPTWVLEPVMERVAEGLNGRTRVSFSMFPRQTFIFYPSSPETGAGSSGTDMLKLQPGFHMNRLGAVEAVAIRLASFASNTASVERLSNAAFRMPGADEFSRAQHRAVANFDNIRRQSKRKPTAEELAREILNMASATYGPFFFLNSPKFQEAVRAMEATTREFWTVEDPARELFTRLAAEEASQSLAKIQSDLKELYSPVTMSLCRFFSSAGASGMWFGGSFPDMLVAGILAMTVGYLDQSMSVAFEERVLTEVVDSFVVGLTAGLVSITWPNTFCFGAIAIPAVLELMQGFKVVYAVIEVMSRNLVSGTSRMLEGLLFTGLISYNLRLGLRTACRLMFGWDTPLPKDVSAFLLSFHEINKLWYFPLLPLASLAWSTLFKPSYFDLPWMMFHGMLAFALNMGGAPSFAAAMCVTFSAGIMSRFTGREALGNTVAGLYALVPGAYMVRGMLSSTTASFLESVVTESVAIGLGAWTGTILCSPTILGKSSRFQGWYSGGKNPKPKALLYF